MYKKALGIRFTIETITELNRVANSLGYSSGTKYLVAFAKGVVAGTIEPWPATKQDAAWRKSMETRVSLLENAEARESTKWMRAYQKEKHRQLVVGGGLDAAIESDMRAREYRDGMR